MSDEQISKFLQELYAIDPEGKLASGFLGAENKAQWLKDNAQTLEGYSDYTRKYSNIDDFMGDRYKALGDLWQSQGGKIPSDARIMAFQEKHKDISKEDIYDWFEKSNKYYAEELARQEEEAGIARRAKEIKEEWGPIQKLLASDYSKQRYIHDPNASMFGKEGTFNPYSSQGQEEISDVIFGGAGAVGDLVPGVGGSLVGPATRTLRDVYHVAKDSPYQKDASQIGRDFLADAGMNVGTAYLPTAILNRGSKLSRNISKTESVLRDAGEVRLANQSKQSVKEGVKQLNYNDIYNGISYPDLEKKIRDLPDGPMKQDLEALTRRGASQSEIGEHLVHWESVAPTTYIPKGKNKPVEVSVPPTAYYKGTKVNPYWSNTPVGGYVAEQAKAGTRGRTAHVLAGFAEGARQAGEPLVKEGYTYTGRGSEPKKVETKIEKAIIQNQKDWYKTNYERDWEMGFVPKKVDGDPLWEAYKEWKEGK